MLKCEIPSFVADFVSVISWTDDQGIEFFPSDQSMGTCKQPLILQLNWVHTSKLCSLPIRYVYLTLPLKFPALFSVVSQDYVTRVHEIDVILGNSGLLKCEIPSFVIDFVSVTSWIDDQGNEYFLKAQSPSFTGKNILSTWIYYIKDEINQ